MVCKHVPIHTYIYIDSKSQSQRSQAIISQHGYCNQSRSQKWWHPLVPYPRRAVLYLLLSQILADVPTSVKIHFILKEWKYFSSLCWNQHEYRSTKVANKNPYDLVSLTQAHSSLQTTDLNETFVTQSGEFSDSPDYLRWMSLTQAHSSLQTTDLNETFVT